MIDSPLLWSSLYALFKKKINISYIDWKPLKWSLIVNDNIPVIIVLRVHTSKTIVPDTTHWDRLKTVKMLSSVYIPDSSQNVARVQLLLSI